MKFFPAAFNRIARALDVLWGTPTNGQVFTYDSSLQKAKWANGGSGDMLKSTYDADNNGVVDNSTQLAGQAGSHYLARGNHTGTQAANTITGLATVATSGSAADLSGTLSMDRIASGAIGGTKLTTAYLPLAGGTVTGAVSLNGNVSFGALINSNITQQADDAICSLLSATATAPKLILGTVPLGSYPYEVGQIWLSAVNTEVTHARIAAEATTATRGKLTLQTSDNSGALINALVLDYQGNATFAGLVNKASLGVHGTPILRGNIRDLNLDTSNPVAWKASGFNIDTGGRVISAECLTSGEASLQTFTLRSSFIQMPSGFITFKTTGAFTLSLIADDTSSANAVLTGYTVTGYSDRESTGTTLVTASGLTQAVTSASVPKVVSVNRSAFASTTVPTCVTFEFELSVRSSKCVTVADFNLLSE